jgi:hypothetical protein
MFLREIGLSVFGALLIFVAPAQQAQAATMLGTNAHSNEQLYDQTEYGRNLRHRQQHWRNHHHDPSDYYNQNHQHNQQRYYDQYQHEYLRHRRPGH